MALRGLKVVEMAGLAPGPFAGMILADFGASVVRVDKPNQPPLDTLARNKRSLAVSLKQPGGVGVVKDLCASADILIEPYRPGVMEKLGLGPEPLMNINPRLIYARLTGFGQSGSLAQRAGHDINYLATSGVLSMLGRKNEKPYAPINLLADFAGGSFTCVIGILMALIERSTSGKGQVVDAAMVDGCAYMGSFLLSSQAIGLWTGPRGTNLLDGGAPYYDTYETADGKYMSVGALEPQFYQALLNGLGISVDSVGDQLDQDSWPEMRKTFTKIFATKTRDEWTEIFSKVDACVEPVLEMDEAGDHPHNKHRHLYRKSETGFESMPAPKLSRTPAEPGSYAQPEVGQHTLEILKELKYSDSRIRGLVEGRTVYQCDTRAKL